MMTSGSYSESDRPRKVDALFLRELHQSRLIIVIDGGEGRANEDRTTFSQAQRGGGPVRLMVIKVTVVHHVEL